MSLYLGNRRIAPIIRTTGQSGLKILVVESLPTQDIATDAIYLVPKQNPSANDYYDEYIYVDSAWEIFGEDGAVSSVNSKTGNVVLNANDVGALPIGTPIPSKTSDLQNDSGYISGITSSDVTSALGFTPYSADNPSGYVNSTQAKNAAPVQSVNGKTGNVSLSAQDVDALPSNTPIHNVPSGGTSGQVLTKSSNSDYALEWTSPSGSVSSVNGKTGAVVLNAEDVGALPNNTVIPTKTSELTNDSNFITSSQAPVQSVNGQTGTVILSASDVGALPDSTAIPSKTSDLTNDSGFITGMVILAYGSSTWQDFLDAYSANKVVYARASSNANPAVGSQTRLAFMAYVNNETNPTSVEFQYYRSVSSHSATQQGDQVFVYTLKSTGWSVITREASVEVTAGTNMTQSYSKDKLTLNAVVPPNVSSFTNDAGYLTLADLPIYQGGVS